MCVCDRVVRDVGGPYLSSTCSREAGCRSRCPGTRNDRIPLYIHVCVRGPAAHDGRPRLSFLGDAVEGVDGRRVPLSSRSLGASSQELVGGPLGWPDTGYLGPSQVWCGRRCMYVCGMTVRRGLGPRPAISAILLNFTPYLFILRQPSYTVGCGAVSDSDSDLFGLGRCEQKQSLDWMPIQIVSCINPTCWSVSRCKLMFGQSHGK